MHAGNRDISYEIVLRGRVQVRQDLSPQYREVQGPQLVEAEVGDRQLVQHRLGADRVLRVHSRRVRPVFLL